MDNAMAISVDNIRSRGWTALSVASLASLQACRLAFV